ncbi:MAG: cytochrome c oxidase subunit II transmembrane domain-containing protein, partial [Cyanobacteria bacterium P01_D01_bin.73]
MKIPNAILAMLGGIALTLFCLWFSQNIHLLPVSASANAAEIDSLFNVMLTISLGLFVLVQGTLVYAGIKFRKRPGDETDGPPIRGNIPLEILWTSIPAVLVLGIALYSYEIYSEMGGLDPMSANG